MSTSKTEQKLMDAEALILDLQEEIEALQLALVRSEDYCDCLLEELASVQE